MIHQDLGKDMEFGGLSLLRFAEALRAPGALLHYMRPDEARARTGDLPTANGL